MENFDFDSSIKEYEYTRKAVYEINKIIKSEDFADMDADMIFDYLVADMEVVLFPDYLKRYIYNLVGPEEKFESLDDSFYYDVIKSTMKANNAPYSLTKTSTKAGAMIKLWLSQAGTKRSVIFVLGFIFQMTGDDVSEFLTKVLKESDFDFSNPEETIYWYCYENALPYSSAVRMMTEYTNSSFNNLSLKKFLLFSHEPKKYLKTEDNLFQYLFYLKNNELTKLQDHTFEMFEKLYSRCLDIIKKIYDEDGISSGKVGASDIEKMMSSGIPVSDNNNLVAMSSCQLSNLFQHKRISRQRINAILTGVQKVDRFDIISLTFFIHANSSLYDEPKERFMHFIDDVNSVLRSCNMQEIYPVNPYEAFVLMCMISFDPMDTYAQIWEMSYSCEE